MKIDAMSTPSEVAKELGKRLAQMRLSFNQTRAQLAEKAGVSVSSIARLEGGNSAVKLEILLAVCSALALTANFDLLVPEVELTPLQILQGASLPKRAHRKTRSKVKWGDGHA